MVKTCKNCGKRIGMFVTSEVNEQGDILCKECSEKIKVEQEAAQKQKEELEYKTRLAKALSNNPQWEYKTLNLNISENTLGPESEEELTRQGLEGWNLVSAFAVSSLAAKPAENPEPEKKPEQPQPPQPQPEQPQSETPSTGGVLCIFKRKI